MPRAWERKTAVGPRRPTVPHRGRGAEQIRTAVRGFAGRCLTSRPRRRRPQRLQERESQRLSVSSRFGNGRWVPEPAARIAASTRTAGRTANRGCGSRCGALCARNAVAVNSASGVPAWQQLLNRVAKCLHGRSPPELDARDEHRRRDRPPRKAYPQPGGAGRKVAIRGKINKLAGAHTGAPDSPVAAGPSTSSNHTPRTGRGVLCDEAR